MRQTVLRPFGLLAALMIVAGLALAGCAGPASTPCQGNGPQPKDCSAFAVTRDERVFLGANADSQSGDFSGTDTLLFLFPASEQGYGFMAYGWLFELDGRAAQNYMGGMNESGLAFAATGVPETPLNPHPERPLHWARDLFFINALRKCSDVDCVVERANLTDWGSSSESVQQTLFADRTGAMVAFSAGADGELAFVRHEGDGYLAITNFNLAFPESGVDESSRRRYDAIVGALSQVSRAEDLTVSLAQSAVDAAHVEGTAVNSVYSHVLDLRNGDVYVYHFHQFDSPARFNLLEELDGGDGAVLGNIPVSALERENVRQLNSIGLQPDRVIAVPDMVSQETRDKANAELQSYTGQEKRLVALTYVVRGVEILLVCGMVAGIVYLVVRRMRGRRRGESRDAPSSASIASGRRRF